jgi:hypothetical protein
MVIKVLYESYRSLSLRQNRSQNELKACKSMIGRLFFFGACIKSCIEAQNVGASFCACFEMTKIGRTR